MTTIQFECGVSNNQWQHSLLVQYILVRMRLLRPEKRKITILNKVSSILSPGRATLLLGPPGGGKVRFAVHQCGTLCQLERIHILLCRLAVCCAACCAVLPVPVALAP